jgi:hypothetical protein
MAKAKTGVNKSEAIRGAYKELPDAKAKEIVAHLKAKGIDVSEQLVYQVKKSARKRSPDESPVRFRRPRPWLLPPPRSPLPHPMGAWASGLPSPSPRLLLKRSEAGLL